MSEYTGHKSMTVFYGRVEYAMQYDNPIMCGHLPDEIHTEVESFRSIKELIRLMSADTLLAMKAAHAADDVKITGVLFDAQNHESGDALQLRVGEALDGSVSAKVDVQTIDSKLVEKMQDVEEDVLRLLGTIRDLKN